MIHTLPTTIAAQQRAKKYFKYLQKSITLKLEEFEQAYHAGNNAPRFVFDDWTRQDKHYPDRNNAKGGGGRMAVLRGNVFAKAGVNFSEVYGHFDPKFRKEIPHAGKSGAFWASGISLVIHPTNPWVPIVHMNTRMIVTEKAWYGGGIDLTPALAVDSDTQEFHDKLRQCCDHFDIGYYARYKQACDEYFYLPHRQEPRGVSGIFVDNLMTNQPEQDWQFIADIGNLFPDCYMPIVQRRMHKPYGNTELAAQRLKRSRYVEFNLLFDRGTRFGIMTGGHTEAILVSLPPDTGW